MFRTKVLKWLLFVSFSWRKKLFSFTQNHNNHANQPHQPRWRTSKEWMNGNFNSKIFQAALRLLLCAQHQYNIIAATKHQRGISRETKENFSLTRSLFKLAFAQENLLRRFFGNFHRIVNRTPGVTPAKLAFRVGLITSRKPRLIKKSSRKFSSDEFNHCYFISHLIEFSFRGGEKVRKTWNAEWNYFNPNENVELNFEQKLQ